MAFLDTFMMDEFKGFNNVTGIKSIGIFKQENWKYSLDYFRPTKFFQAETFNLLD